MTPLLLILVPVVLVLLWALWTYNRLVGLRQEAEQTFSGIEIQLKRRADLIPMLVEAVRGYAGHEQETLAHVTAARTRAAQAQGQAQIAEADGQMQEATRSLMAIAEAYPDLKANESFLLLQEELETTEDRIAGTRALYNVVVERLNTMIQQVPSSVIAGVGRFELREFYRLEDDSDRAPVAVKLTPGSSTP